MPGDFFFNTFPVLSVPCVFHLPQSFTLVSDVADSEYLSTIGKTLHPDIKVQLTLLIAIPTFLENY